MRIRMARGKKEKKKDLPKSNRENSREADAAALRCTCLSRTQKTRRLLLCCAAADILNCPVHQTKRVEKAQQEIAETTPILDETLSVLSSDETEWILVEVEETASRDTEPAETSASGQASDIIKSDINSELSWKELWSEALINVNSGQKVENKPGIPSDSSQVEETENDKTHRTSMKMNFNKTDAMFLNHKCQLDNETFDNKFKQMLEENAVKDNPETSLDESSLIQGNECKTSVTTLKDICTTIINSNKVYAVNEIIREKIQPQAQIVDCSETGFDEIRTVKSLKELCTAAFPVSCAARKSFSDIKQREGEAGKDVHIHNYYKEPKIIIHNVSQECEKPSTACVTEFKETEVINQVDTEETAVKEQHSDIATETQNLRASGDGKILRSFHSADDTDGVCRTEDKSCHIYSAKAEIDNETTTFISNEILQDNTTYKSILQTKTTKDGGLDEKTKGDDDTLEQQKISETKLIQDDFETLVSKYLTEHKEPYTSLGKKARDNFSEENGDAFPTCVKDLDRHVRIYSNEDIVYSETGGYDIDLNEAYNIYLAYEAKRNNIASDVNIRACRKTPYNELLSDGFKNEISKEDSTRTEPNNTPSNEIKQSKYIDQEYMPICKSHRQDKNQTEENANRTNINQANDAGHGIFSNRIKDGTSNNFDNSYFEDSDTQNVLDKTRRDARIERGDDKATTKLIAKLILPLPALNQYSLDNCRVKGFKTAAKDSNKLMLELEIDYKTEEEEMIPKDKTENFDKAKGQIQSTENSIINEDEYKRGNNTETVDKDHDIWRIGVGAKPKMPTKSVRRVRNYKSVPKCEDRSSDNSTTTNRQLYSNDECLPGKSQAPKGSPHGGSQVDVQRCPGSPRKKKKRAKRNNRW